MRRSGAINVQDSVGIGAAGIFVAVSSHLARSVEVVGTEAEAAPAASPAVIERDVKNRSLLGVVAVSSGGRVDFDGHEPGDAREGASTSMPSLPPMSEPDPTSVD